jgi:DNA-binding NarL/FixJ family response regulator
MLSKPDIIIVDCHQTFRQGLISILSTENIARVIAEASNSTEFIELISHLKPDLALIDVDMPNMNGVETARQALELLPDLKIIAFTMFGDDGYYTKMIDLGVKGFILKSSGINELESAVRDVMMGKRYFSGELMGKQKNGSLNQQTFKIDESDHQKNKNLQMNSKMVDMY